MKLAFVILTKNSGRTLEKCLDAVAKLKDEFEPEVIVVDAGSTDNTLNIVEKYREELNIKVLYDGGRGLGYARDIGWRASSADYIVMLDSDVIVNRNFLRKAVELLQQDERLGAISAKLKPTSLDKGWVGKFQEKNLAIHLHHLDPPYPAEAVALHTACTVFRRKALEEVGGFDAYFNLAKEDSDVSYRIRKAGYKLSYLNIYVLHLERARILRLNFRYGRSFILIAKKHPDMENFLRLKNIVLMVCIFIPMLQPMLYLYYLSRYVKIPHLTLSEKFILPFIELVRQDVRIVGALYQLIQNRVIR
ncbi:MAG: glycosyltransferase [Thaumarchaeota archaeon]|nr:glycosyltransferase [Candidatus Terraquivivens yellowstonensis]